MNPKILKQIKDYIAIKKELQGLVLTFIEENDDENVNLDNITNFNQNQKMLENKMEFNAFLELIMKIANNHHRSELFFEKIEKLLIFYSNNIKQTFTNLEIFQIFKSNKRVLLILFTNKIITMDQSIFDNIMNDSCLNSQNYQFYFYTEIKPFLNEEMKKQIEDEMLEFNPNIFLSFEENRLKGVNDSYICSLIQNDSIEEFVQFANQSNLPLNSTIEPSIFETNPFLIKKEEISLIEYAAFYGSIKIFQYLRVNKIELTPSLFYYAIHSQDAQLIHLLEENKIQLNKSNYQIIIKESIKCHHNNIANYFLDNFQSHVANKYAKQNILFDNYVNYAFRYYNYDFFPSDFKDENIFYSLCQYGYVELVKLIYNSKIYKSKDKEIFNLFLITFH